MSPILRGAAAGVAAAGLGVAVAELLAAATRPQAGPLVAVGGAVIDATPTPIKEFAVRELGTADKPVLLGTIALVLALFTVVVGVLAPANPAFEAVPADALNGLLADTAALTTVLTHHVIPGRLTPEELAGTHTTLNNDEVTIEGSGEDFSIAMDGTVVGMEASVICGNVQTANATVYIVDSVLLPKS